MNKRWGLVFAATAGAALAACTTPGSRPSMSTAQAVALIPTGTPLLRCRQDCLQAWRAAQPEAAGLLRSGRWSDLAMLLVHVGYQDDLSLYYLARAAQGMGYSTAAASYYRQSIALSGTSISCENLSRQCGGLALPEAAEQRLAALRRLPIRRRPAVAKQPETREPSAPQPAADTMDTPAPPPETMAPPVPEPPPVASPPPARPPAPGASDFIEPPPAPK